jgi:hypothetical protein
LASGALVIVDGDVAGREIPAEPVVPAAARFAEEGDAAGFSPGTSTAVDACAVGSCGSAERATAEESAGVASDFHQAHRGGPD